MLGFIQFVTTLWGALAAISITFPFANDLIGILILPHSVATKAVAVSSIGSVFAFLFGFAYAGAKDDPLNDAWGAFACAAGMIGLFLIIEAYEHRYETLKSYFLAALYCGVFGLFTFAFTVTTAVIFLNKERYSGDKNQGVDS